MDGLDVLFPFALAWGWGRPGFLFFSFGLRLPALLRSGVVWHGAAACGALQCCLLRAYWPPCAAGCCFRCHCSPARRPPASASGEERYSAVLSSPSRDSYLARRNRNGDFELPDVVALT
jgi:hypothetical protein